MKKLVSVVIIDSVHSKLSKPRVHPYDRIVKFFKAESPLPRFVGDRGCRLQQRH